MREKKRKSFRAVMSLTLAVLTLLSLTVPAFSEENAAEITESQTYVLGNYGSAGFEGYKFQYESIYTPGYDYDGKYAKNNPNNKSIPVYIYTLYSRDTGTIVPGYCMDIFTTANQGTTYRRMNLEDSAYSASAAGLIRAILDTGFYLAPVENESDASHESRVNAKVAALGSAAGVDDLTLSQAICATQCALWRVVHGVLLEFPTLYRYASKSQGSSTRYYELCNAGYETSSSNPEIEAKIRQVYEYLLSLEPMEATQKTVSPASFVTLGDPVAVQNSDGTYNITVTTTVDVDMAAGDELVLKAVLDGTAYTAQKNLSGGEQEVTLTISNVPAGQHTQKVTLSISGYQTVEGYFLFDADGERGASQTMVGYDNSRLPVYAKVEAQESRVLNIYKSTRFESSPGSFSRIPLSGITFDIYFVADMDTYLANAGAYTDPAKYAKGADAPEYSVTTGNDGRVSMNFTQQGMADGLYVVQERNHPAIVSPIDPFFLVMPATKADGTGYEYNITLQPKNDVKGLVRIEKDVISLGNDEASVAVEASHTWIIGATVPEDIAQGKSFVISDTLDSWLDFAGNVRARLESADGTQVIAELAADTDYTLTVTEASGDQTSDAFTIELTGAGRNAISAAIGENAYENYMLRIWFDARVNTDAAMGEDIPNKAELKYVNSFNIAFDVESDVPKVYTGAANVLKRDANNPETVLSGATFTLYRLATQEEVDNQVQGLTGITGVNAPVMQVEFFSSAAMDGEKVTSVTTDANGRAAIYGLPYGEYYLVETKAPAGYNLLKDPVALTIDGDSHTEENVVVIENVGGTVLPATGGMGTAVYSVTGAVMMCAAAVFLVVDRRRRRG